MLKVSFYVALFLITQQVAAAEARAFAEVYAGYSILNGNLAHTAGGWEISYTQNLNVNNRKPWLGIQADFSSHSQSVQQLHVHDVLFGPQANRSFGRLSLTGRSLAGFAHTAGPSGGSNGFAAMIGGGTSWDINDAISLRFAQVDYYSARAFGFAQQNVRFSAGVVLRFVGFFDGPPPPPPPPPPEPRKNFRR